MFLHSLLALAAAFPADTTSTRYLDYYRGIMSLASLPQSAADVKQLVLKRDAGVITLNQGTIYLLSPVGGRTVAAVFRGAGRLTLTPPEAPERDALHRLLGGNAVDDSITEAILIFDDSTATQLRGLSFHGGDVPDDLLGHVHDFVQSLRGENDGAFMPSVMASLLSESPNGFLMVHVRRANGSPLLFQYDPDVVHAVQLFKPASKMHWGANWSVVTEFAPAQPLAGSAGMWEFRQRVAVPSYKLEVWLKTTGIADLSFAASAIASFRAHEASGPWMHFALHRKLVVDSGRWSDGTAVPTFKAKNDDDLWVRAPHRLAAGDSAFVTLYYHGDLIDRYANWFFIDPGAAWYPKNLQGGDAALFDVTFHSPAWYPIASIGERSDSSVDGKVMTTRWVTKRPTPFATFNLGLFTTYHAQYEGAPPLDVMMSEEAHRALRNAMMDAGYMMLAQSHMQEAVAADISNSLKWFTHAFGPPLYDHFYITEIPYYEGVSFPGMIDLSWVTFQNTSLDGFDEFFRAHEVSHQWWGNGVRPATYRDTWLAEGVASFCGLWYLQSIRKGNKEYFKFLDAYVQNIKDNRDGGGATWLGYRDASPERPYGYQAMIYEKGAWIMHMLRILMLDLNTGKDDRFSAMMHDFHDSFSGRSATTDDFRGIVEKHVGVPMDWFFNEWVKGTAIPTYHVAWTSEATPDGKQRARFRITQENVPPDFQAYVLVSADLGQNRFANFRIKVTGAQTEYASPVLPIAPQAVTFNELHSVLADVKMERW